MAAGVDTFTSAYEMRVAELEAENGELHGFMSALLNDPTSGMLKAVMVLQAEVL